MEFLALVALLLLIVPVCALVVALSASRRASELEAQTRALRHELAHTRALLERLHAHGESTASHAPSTLPSSPAERETADGGAAAPVAFTAPPAGQPDHAPPVKLPKASLPDRHARTSGVWAWLVAFFSGPSAFARIGGVVLLVGVGLLLKYAADLGLLSLQLRLWTVVGVGGALLAVGWHLRERRPAYAVALMGTAFGLWYLTVFAALRFYQLLPSGVAFTLLALLGVTLGALAVARRAQVLAVLGLLGGFLAPVLTSGGAGEGGSGTQLFAYYALLNALALPLAVRSGWRALPTLGFLATFGVGTAWGVLSYQPQAFWTTEPFLVLFFLMYALLPLAQQHFTPGRNVNVAVMFATPIVFLALQALLVAGARLPMAVTALAVSAFYALLAQRGGTRLRAPHAALAVAAGTLSVPFALGADLTGAAWALEGAALAWHAARTRSRSWAAWSAAVQVIAAFGVACNAVAGGVPAPMHGWALAATLAFAGALSARFLTTTHASLSRALGWWALVAWLSGGAYGLLSAHPTGTALALLVGYVAVSTPGLTWVGTRWQVEALRCAALLPVPFAVPVLLLLAPVPYSGAAWSALVLAVTAQLTVLSVPALPFPSRLRGAFVALTVWFALLSATWNVSVMLDLRAAHGWALIAWGALPAVTVTLLLTLGRNLPWVRGDFTGFVRLAVLPVVSFTLLWAFVSNFSDGRASLRSALPMVGPLDLTLLGVWLTAWLTLTRAGAARIPGLTDAMQPVWARFPARSAAWLLGGLAFLLLSGTVLRAVRSLTGVAWDAHALLTSGVAQTALTLTWTLLGAGLMLWASRRGVRDAWLAGAVALGVVTVKLFVVDLAGTSALARIVSFVGVGALLLLIGYLSPAPPRDTTGQAS